MKEMIMNMLTPRKLRVGSIRIYTRRQPAEEFKDTARRDWPGAAPSGVAESQINRTMGERMRLDLRAAAAEQQLRKPGGTVDSSDLASKTVM